MISVHMIYIYDQYEGSKDQFDAILSPFCFSGNENVPYSNQALHKEQNSNIIYQESPKTSGKERNNKVTNDRRKQVTYEFKTFTVPRRVPKIIKKHIKISLSWGPFIFVPETGVNVPNP